MKYYDDYRKYFSNIQRKKQVLVNCPFHNDNTPSLSINLENGLFKCFACNESGNYNQFIQKLNNETVVIKNKKIYIPITKLSLEEYSRMKKIPLDYLKDTWKLKDYENGVLFPYLDEKGYIVKEKVRYGNKQFKYLNNDKPLCLYGLQNIKKIKEKGYVILVEGESDTQTLSYAKYPTLGVPGANLFKEKWVSLLKNLEVIIYKEPDDGGIKFATSIYKMLLNKNHNKKISLISLNDKEVKDPSELFIKTDTIDQFKKIMDDKIDRRWIMKKETNNFIEPLGDVIIPSGFKVNDKGVWFTKKEEELLDVFLGKGGVKKYLNGRNFYWDMFDDINEALEPLLPLFQNTMDNIGNRIKDKYSKSQTEENVLE